MIHALIDSTLIISEQISILCKKCVFVSKIIAIHQSFLFINQHLIFLYNVMLVCFWVTNHIFVNYIFGFNGVVKFADSIIGVVIKKELIMGLNQQTFELTDLYRLECKNLLKKISCGFYIFYLLVRKVQREINALYFVLASSNEENYCTFWNLNSYVTVGEFLEVIWDF